MKPLLRPEKLRAFWLACATAYVCMVALSIVIGHVLIVFLPDSAWGGRVVEPIARGVEFLDAHWRGALLLVAPFLLPVVGELLPRLRKVGTVEFDALQLEAVGVREKPASSGAVAQ